MRNISITVSGFTFEAELNDSPTADLIWNSLPLKSTVSVWGDELYFQLHQKIGLEKNAKAEVEIGDLAFWPVMPAFCIFFGPTPMSNSMQPVAADKVNVFGKLNNPDRETLKTVKEGDAILVQKSG